MLKWYTISANRDTIRAPVDAAAPPVQGPAKALLGSASKARSVCFTWRL